MDEQIFQDRVDIRIPLVDLIRNDRWSTLMDYQCAIKCRQIPVSGYEMVVYVTGHADFHLPPWKFKKQAQGVIDATQYYNDNCVFVWTSLLPLYRDPSFHRNMCRINCYMRNMTGCSERLHFINAFADMVVANRLPPEFVRSGQLTQTGFKALVNSIARELNTLSLV